jgi:3-oxoacyl-[acyl-carrier-protein] synthase-1
MDVNNIPLLINIAPPDRPALSAGADQIVLSGLARELGRSLPKGSAIISMGRVGLPHLIARATERLKLYPLCILVCAESMLRQALVVHYCAKNRLLCEENSNGFTLGEASAALLVARMDAYPGPQLAIRGMGSGMEPSGDGGTREMPVTAKGLTDAMRAALTVSETPFYDIPMVMGDMNGEHFKFKELSYAVMRLDRLPPEKASRRPRGHIEHWNVVETIGEVGAALMPAAMGWAFEAGKSGYLPGKRVLFFAGEDDGQRVAIVGEWHNG